MFSLKGLAAPIAVFFFIQTPAAAGTAFGTDQDARSIAGKMVKIIADKGLETAIGAMHDPSHPFVNSEMGVHIFEGSIIVADNREPELIATSYAEVQDLTEEPMWPRIVAAADADTDAMLKWYHYDTEEVYGYHCLSQWAVKPEVLVMVCR